MAIAVLVICGTVVTGTARAQDALSTPTVGTTPDSALYLDPVFDFRKTREDVVYGRNIDWRGEPQELLLDVWEPKNNEHNRPAVLWIQGGGFNSVFKDGAQFLRQADGFMRRGYVVVSIVYRLRSSSGGVENALGDDAAAWATSSIEAAKDAIEDAKAAVRWIRRRARDLRVDASRIAAAGGSAGAVVALGLAFDSEDSGTSGNEGWSNSVAAAISRAGGYSPGVLGDVIRPGDPPIQVFHGTHDSSVPIIGSLVPCAMTLALGNVCEAHIYPGLGHGLPPKEQFDAATASFLYRHMINPQPFPYDR